MREKSITELSTPDLRERLEALKVEINKLNKEEKAGDNSWARRTRTSEVSMEIRAIVSVLTGRWVRT